MKFIETFMPGLIIIEPTIFEDDRGFFYELYNKKHSQAIDFDFDFKFETLSKSNHGVIRGLNYQINQSQNKLVTVLNGEIFDIALDIRKGSPTFGKWIGFTLNSTTKKQIYIPKGFAHGYSVLSESAEIFIKFSELYSRENERKINPFDTSLGIDWKIDSKEIIVAAFDKVAPNFFDLPKTDIPSISESKKSNKLKYFLSHSSKDKKFSDKLYEELLMNGMEVWYAPEDMKIGNPIRQTIEDSIKKSSNLILILSKNSINSQWVEKEVETIFELERLTKKLLLYPISIDNSIFNSNIAWASDIRRNRQIFNFYKWKDDKQFKMVLNKLIKELNYQKSTANIL